MPDEPANNIDRFNDLVAEIFARLYGKFPIPEHIQVADLVDVNIDPTFQNTSQEEWNSVWFAEETLRWLKASGYIWCGDIGNTVAESVVLSPKALELLKSVPRSLQPDETKSIGRALVEATAPDIRRKLVDIALTQGFRLFGSA